MHGNRTTRRQTYSPTIQLAEIDIWTVGHFGARTCLFGSWTLRPHAGRFGQSLKLRSDWQFSGTRKNAILSTHSRSASSAHNVANRKRYYAALLPRRGPHIASHSVCPSVPLSSVTSRHLENYNDTHVLFGRRRGLHIVRPSRPHKLVYLQGCKKT